MKRMAPPSRSVRTWYSPAAMDPRGEKTSTGCRGSRIRSRSRMGSWASWTASYWSLIHRRCQDDDDQSPRRWLNPPSCPRVTHNSMLQRRILTLQNPPQQSTDDVRHFKTGDLWAPKLPKLDFSDSGKLGSVIRATVCLCSFATGATRRSSPDDSNNPETGTWAGTCVINGTELGCK